MSNARLYNTRTDDVIEPDVSGAIWNLLDAPTRLDRLVHALLNQFEVGEEQRTLETRAFLDDMVAQGLVVAGDV